LTEATPKAVLISIGQTEQMKITKMPEIDESLIVYSASGIQASGEIGLSTWMKGSKARRSSGDMPITKPSGTATAQASRKAQAHASQRMRPAGSRCPCRWGRCRRRVGQLLPKVPCPSAPASGKPVVLVRAGVLAHHLLVLDLLGAQAAGAGRAVPGAAAWPCQMARKARKSSSETRPALRFRDFMRAC
jgi:hypothetical protein